MKKHLKIILFFSLMGVISCLLIFAATILLIIPSIQIAEAQEIVLGAHRGSSVKFTENTIPAFEDALKNDEYKFIEFDIQYTKDKVIVVHHDRSLLRLQNKLEKIQDLTYEELSNISNYHIPEYDEVMNLIDGKKPINIEIKSHGNLTEDEDMIDFVVKDLQKRNVINETLISSISNDVIKYTKEKYPETKTGRVYYITTSTFLHFNTFTNQIYKEATQSKTDYIMLHGSNLKNYGSLRELLPPDKTLVIWYFNDKMYIVQPKPESWVFNIKEQFKKTKEDIGFSPKEQCLWWC